MIREVIALSIMIAYTTGSKCCLSKQLELKSESIVLSYNVLMQAKMVWSMDFDRGFTNLVYHEISPEPPRTSRILQDFKHNVTYNVEMDTGVCSMSNYTFNYFQQCFDDSQKINSMYFGKPGHSLQSNVYLRSIYGIEMKYTLTSDCVPLYLTVASVAHPADGMTVVKFYNYTEGIKDPSVFDIPKKCPTENQPTLFHKRWFNHHVSIQDFK